MIPAASIIPVASASPILYFQYRMYTTTCYRCSHTGAKSIYTYNINYLIIYLYRQLPSPGHSNGMYSFCSCGSGNIDSEYRSFLYWLDILSSWVSSTLKLSGHFTYVAFSTSHCCRRRSNPYTDAACSLCWDNLKNCCLSKVIIIIIK